MGKKRRKSKKSRDAERNRALERELLGDSISSIHKPTDLVKPTDPIKPIDTIVLENAGEIEESDRDTRISGEREFDIAEVIESKIEDARVDSTDPLRGNHVDVRVVPVVSFDPVLPVDSIDPITSVVIIPDSSANRSDQVDPVESGFVESSVVYETSDSIESKFDKGSLYGNTFGTIWPDDPDRHRRVSVWAFVSGAMLTIATLGVLFGGLTGDGGSEKGRTIVSRPGEHRVADPDFVFKGRSVKVEIVGGMVTQTSEEDLVKKVESVIGRKKTEWKTDKFKKMESMSREMKVYLMDGTRTAGMFEVYVDYDTTKVILKSEKGYIVLPDGVGKQIFSDLSKAGKYTD